VIFLGVGSSSNGSIRSTEELIHRHATSGFCPVAVEGGDAALIVFTSGTTGPAKGVCLTHASLEFQVNYLL